VSGSMQKDQNRYRESSGGGEINRLTSGGGGPEIVLTQGDSQIMGE
jgi:hypothetical protein